jgi:hypothetical protein
MKHVGTGMIIAGAAAALILGGSVVARAGSETGGSVKCVGGNACKGQGACATATHDCAGKNECKGKGWVMTKTTEECKEHGGTPEESK